MAARSRHRGLGGGPVFYPHITGFPSKSEPDEWQTRHIMLERKNGVWGLGDRPYTIRW